MTQQLHQAIRNIFRQLSDTLHLLSAEQYTRPIHILFNASIGQHTRHIVELFICLNQGYKTNGMVNYDKRERDYRIETEKEFAIKILNDIYSSLQKPDKQLVLEATYDETSEELITIPTNYYREVVYNLEHAVHHMALIRIGISEVSDITLPEGYGVASSTLKHRQLCAQ